MNVFETVKANVTARMVAEHYGLKVNRHGMACCPFHNDKNPSLKLTERYYCFGCGEKGDAIDFVGKYFGLEPKDAAIKICQDFGLEYDSKSSYRSPPKSVKPIRPKKTDEQIFKETCDYCYRVLCDYRQLLDKWKIEYAPKDESCEWHPYFCEALQESDHIEYLLDILWEGTATDRALVISDCGRLLVSGGHRLATTEPAGEKGVEIEKRIKQLNTRANEESERSEQNHRKKSEPCL